MWNDTCAAKAMIEKPNKAYRPHFCGWDIDSLQVIDPQLAKINVVFIYTILLWSTWYFWYCVGVHKEGPNNPSFGKLQNTVRPDSSIFKSIFILFFFSFCIKYSDGIILYAYFIEHKLPFYRKIVYWIASLSRRDMFFLDSAVCISNHLLG